MFAWNFIELLCLEKIKISERHSSIERQNIVLFFSRSKSGWLINSAVYKASLIAPLFLDLVNTNSQTTIQFIPQLMTNNFLPHKNMFSQFLHNNWINDDSKTDTSNPIPKKNNKFGTAEKKLNFFIPFLSDNWFSLFLFWRHKHVLLLFMFGRTNRDFSNVLFVWV